MENINQQIISCNNKLQDILKLIPLETNKRRLEELDFLLSEDKIWLDPNKSTSFLKERNKLTSLLDKIEYFKSQVLFYMDVFKEIPDEIIALENNINTLFDELTSFEIKLMFKDPIDDSAAILTISAGAGGLEAANWVTMLFRMYSKYASNQNFSIEILDEEPSKEHSSICTDTITLKISGPYAYGYLKNESGVHRLIRNSPFNADFARHTSFAAVMVVPDIEDNIDIQILDKDIEITAMRAGGSGGQHQNKTNSAVRIKHHPTGINIAVRNERDFHANKKTALKMLKARLYDLEVQKRNKEKDKTLDAQSDISFGSQIRSYIESPQAIVKDHRTNFEIRDFNFVLDGNLDKFISSLLK